MIIRILLIIIFFPLLIKADDSLNNIINKILEENIDVTRQLNIAIQVKDLKTKEEIYSLNPYRIMIPASTTKSFTAYAALKYLGPEFSYSTQILFDPRKIDSNGILSGDLYIKFSGDPSLTAKDFSQIMSELKKYNINDITGDVIVDDSIFDQYYQADGWPWDDSKFCFASPTSAIVVDKNCFYLNLYPAQSIEKT